MAAHRTVAVPASTPESTRARARVGALIGVLAALGTLSACGTGGTAGSIELLEEPHVFTVSPDGGEVRRVTGGPGFHSWPNWSPDGRLAVEAPGGVEVIDRSGAETKPVTGSTLTGMHPVWSPDGDRIAFVGPERDEAHATVETVAPDGTGRRVLARRLLSLGTPWLGWSPDGSKLAFTADRGARIVLPSGTPTVPSRGPVPPSAPARGGQVDVVVVDATTGGAVATVGRPERDEFEAWWLAGGSHLATVSVPVAPPQPGEEQYPSLDVWDLKGHSRTVPLDTAFVSMTPGWAPDGRRVAINGVTAVGDRRAHLYLGDPATGAVREVDAREISAGARPAWSPDGRSIAYARFESLNVLDVESGEIETLVATPRLEIDVVTWSPDGSTIAFTARLRHIGD